MTSAAAKYLIFSLSGKLYALELSQVAEVRAPQPLWPIPAAPACYRGAMNLHGSIVAVMDLAAFMGLPEQSDAEKLIVLHNSIAALAFPVKCVIRIIPAEQTELRDAPEEPFACGLIVLPEGQVTLLDARAIVDQAIASINSR